MGKYLEAKEVVKDSFWIVERGGTKIGTLRQTTDSYILYENTVSYTHLTLPTKRIV